MPEAQITSPPNIRIRAVKLAFCVPAANFSSGLAKHTRCPNKQSCARAPALSQISPCGRRQPFLARKTHTMPAQTIPRMPLAVANFPMRARTTLPRAQKKRRRILRSAAYCMLLSAATPRKIPNDSRRGKNNLPINRPITYSAGFVLGKPVTRVISLMAPRLRSKSMRSKRLSTLRFFDVAEPPLLRLLCCDIKINSFFGKSIKCGIKISGKKNASIFYRLKEKVSILR